MARKRLLAEAQTLKLQQLIVRITLLTVGTLIGALSVLIFFAPANIAPGGISGLAVIFNNRTGFPIGAFILLGNIPILYMAYRMLGGLQAVIWAIYVVVLYSVAIDLLTPFIAEGGVSDDGLLNAIFAGAVGGVGSGFIYRAGGSFGGTSTLSRILQEKLGMPLSSTYMYTNIGIVGLAGVFLGWESALYSLVALMIEGITSDYIMEGPSVIRTVFIITEHPRQVSDVILYVLQRGVTGWEAQGMYTNNKRHMLYVTISRPQAARLRELVHNIDPEAFIIVGQGHTAYGSGFSRQVPSRDADPDKAPLYTQLDPDYAVPMPDLTQINEQPGDVV